MTLAQLVWIARNPTDANKGTGSLVLETKISKKMLPKRIPVVWYCFQWQLSFLPSVGQIDRSSRREKERKRETELSKHSLLKCDFSAVKSTENEKTHVSRAHIVASGKSEVEN